MKKRRKQIIAQMKHLYKHEQGGGVEKELIVLLWCQYSLSQVDLNAWFETYPLPTAITVMKQL